MQLGREAMATDRSRAMRSISRTTERSWGDPIVEGRTGSQAGERTTDRVPGKTTKRFIKFLVTDAVSLDGKSLASIGKLDVLTDRQRVPENPRSAVASDVSG